MRWIYLIKERYKLAVYLTAIFVSIIIANLLEKSQANEVDKSLISMYNDRIIPAKDISAMLGNLYKNQLLLQEHIHSSGTIRYSEIERELEINDEKSDSLTVKFAKTFLVDEEATELNKYKNKIDAYRAIQNEIVTLSRQGMKTEAVAYYHQHSRHTFQGLITHIDKLADIQARVGQKLYQTSHEKLAGAKMLYSLEIAIAIIIGLIVHILLKASTVIKIRPQNSSLN